MASGGGSAWKVAYADFVTAMMAFFMVMWLVAQPQEVKEAVAGYFQDPWGTSSEHAAPASLLPSETHGQARFQDLKMTARGGADGPNDDPLSKSKWAEKLKVHFLRDVERTTPAAVVKFVESSAELDPDGRRQLDALLPSLLGKRNKLEIRGHSTRRPLPAGSPYDNLWQLCYARCLHVMDYLADHGIEPERLRLSQSAAYDPVTRRLESTWQQENSRVEVFLLNELAQPPPGTEKSPQTKSAGQAHRPAANAPASGDSRPETASPPAANTAAGD